ncbi:conserved hypothetical protein [Gammaproteobacteria bacterium]
MEEKVPVFEPSSCLDFRDGEGLYAKKSINYWLSFSMLYFFLLLFFPMIGNAAGLPSFHANYELRVNGMVLGETIFELSKEGGNRLIFTHSTRPTGILAGIDRGRKDRSILILHEDSLRPVEFQGFNTLRGKPREGSLHFNWSAGTVEGIWNNQPWRADLKETFHDPLSYQLAIMLDLAKGKKNLHYLIAEDARIKSYHFRITGNESRKTIAGAFDTVRVERVQDSDKRHTILWCAPTLSYLPVQVEQQDAKTNYLMVLRKVEGL